MGDKKTTSAILRDPRGREWTVELRLGFSRYWRCRIARGWPNELKLGDVCAFELVAGKYFHQSTNVDVMVMDVHIFPAPS